jgi:FtsH-binding integral membrane protein
MKVLANVLAFVFLVIGLLYGLGTINFFTNTGEAHAHHISHLVICWVLALLCLVWARFQNSNSR